MKKILDFNGCEKSDCIYPRIEDYLKNPDNYKYFDIRT
ncbi:MAG: hypothetical protein ACI8P3_002978 [Saprospiraceae bacterium]|jgi:hypothetical protein